MIIDELANLSPVNGVLNLSEVNDSFEIAYKKALKAERRIYSDEELKLLPFASKLNPHREEWKLRSNSFIRFKEYLSGKKRGLNILDLGSGSGWFASRIIREQTHFFYCVDISLWLLEKGAKLFSSENIKFIYADLFGVKFPRSSFDIIVMNASVEYFPDLRILMRELFYLLKSYGEIHIFDSEFCQEDEIDFKKNQILRHYSSIGVPQMKDKVFPHTYKKLNEFNHKFLYNPQNLTAKMMGIAFGKDSPFPWIRIVK